MRSVGRRFAEPALVRGDLAVDVDPQVSGARQALGCAHLGVGVPRLLVDADHAAGRSFRRHEHSVADRATDGHPPTFECPSNAHRCDGHLEVGSTYANHGNRGRVPP